jgi:hypothetical protein
MRLVLQEELSIYRRRSDEYVFQPRVQQAMGGTLLLERGIKIIIRKADTIFEINKC